MVKRTSLLSPKWEFRLSVILFLGFLIVSVFYLEELLGGEMDRMTIISLVIYLCSAAIWLVKAIKDRKKLQEEVSD